MEMIKRLIKGEEGQGLVEYALIIAVLAVLVTVALTPLGKALKEKFTSIGTGIGDDVGTDAFN